jgi:hypothetical protein
MRPVGTAEACTAADVKPEVLAYLAKEMGAVSHSGSYFVIVDGSGQP